MQAGFSFCEKYLTKKVTFAQVNLRLMLGVASQGTSRGNPRENYRGVPLEYPRDPTACYDIPWDPVTLPVGSRENG